MPEADVVYSDVTFKRSGGITKASLPDETTYSEIKTSKLHTEQKVSQHPVSDGGSKVTERASLLILGVLLAAAVVGLGVVIFHNLQMKEKLQTLKNEKDALKKNLTEKLTELKQCSVVQPVCPQPPEAQMNEPCPKCEEDWELHGGKCYYFSTTKSTWNQSRDDCRSKGGDLVKIDSREEQSFLELRLRQKMDYDEDKFWIGLTDSKEEKKWLWVDDSPLNTSLTFWSSNEPDNWTGNNNKVPEGEDCARMGERGGADDLKCWFDRFCKDPHKSICEKSAETGRVTCV